MKLVLTDSLELDTLAIPAQQEEGEVLSMNFSTITLKDIRTIAREPDIEVEVYTDNAALKNFALRYIVTAPVFSKWDNTKRQTFLARHSAYYTWNKGDIVVFIRTPHGILLTTYQDYADLEREHRLSYLFMQEDYQAPEYPVAALHTDALTHA